MPTPQTRQEETPIYWETLAKQTSSDPEPERDVHVASWFDGFKSLFGGRS